MKTNIDCVVVLMRSTWGVANAKYAQSLKDTGVQLSLMSGQDAKTKTEDLAARKDLDLSEKIEQLFYILVRSWKTSLESINADMFS
jgi:hypothetical protein